MNKKNTWKAKSIENILKINLVKMQAFRMHDQFLFYSSKMFVHRVSCL